MRRIAALLAATAAAVSVMSGLAAGAAVADSGSTVVADGGCCHI